MTCKTLTELAVNLGHDNTPEKVREYIKEFCGEIPVTTYYKDGVAKVEVVGNSASIEYSQSEPYMTVSIKSPSGVMDGIRTLDRAVAAKYIWSFIHFV